MKTPKGRTTKPEKTTAGVNSPYPDQPAIKAKSVEAIRRKSEEIPAAYESTTDMPAFEKALWLLGSRRERGDAGTSTVSLFSSVVESRIDMRARKSKGGKESTKSCDEIKRAIGKIDDGNVSYGVLWDRFRIYSSSDPWPDDEAVVQVYMDGDKLFESRDGHRLKSIKRRTFDEYVRNQRKPNADK